MKYKHNKVVVTEETYKYVLSYKRQLMEGMSALLDDVGVRYVISHGNLIEYERGKPIYHDDDIDLRFCVDDLTQWEIYCSDDNNIENPKYNLSFDKRFHDMDKQKINGIQAWLLTFDTAGSPKSFPQMNIHCDLVLNIIESDFWMDYKIDYNKLRKIKLYGVDTYAPSKKDTVKVLADQYGDNYITPYKRHLKSPF